MELLKQQHEPLYPDLLWSRPENKLSAGKLLIIGGQAHDFIKVAEAYTIAEQAGIGSLRIIMPESTHKVTKMLPHIEYAPTNPSGSFSKLALSEFLTAADWSDGVLLAGNLGKNSETSILLESFIEKYTGLLIIAPAALESIQLSPQLLYKRPRTIIGIPMADLQKVGIALELEKPITSQLTVPDLAEIVNTITTIFPVGLVIEQDNNVWTSYAGATVATKKKARQLGQASTIHAAVWAIQQPQKILEAITTGAYHA